MSKLSPKHQFRLERKYRRRAALKYARPKFMKAVTLGQWVVIGCEFMPRLRGWVGDWGSRMASKPVVDIVCWISRKDADFWCYVVVIVYSVLFMEWDTDDTAFHAVRALSRLGIVSWLT